MEEVRRGGVKDKGQGGQIWSVPVSALSSDSVPYRNTVAVLVNMPHQSLSITVGGRGEGGGGL